MVSEATVKMRVRGERVIATAEGNGPVNALDEALRVALSRHYPQLATFELADYKVRILEGSHGTGAVTRVLVETGDGSGRDWTTVGVHENVVEASWHALVDALTYGLARAPAPPDRADADGRATLPGRPPPRSAVQGAGRASAAMTARWSLLGTSWTVTSRTPMRRSDQDVVDGHRRDRVAVVRAPGADQALADRVRGVAVAAGDQGAQRARGRGSR